MLSRDRTLQVLVRSPVGFGLAIPLMVNVSDQTNLEGPAAQNLTINFDPPVVSNVAPKPYDADGQEVTIYGSNFGAEVLGVAPNVTVIVNNVTAVSAEWNLDPTGQEAEGLPYLTAVLGRDTVGTKGANITVAGVRGEIPAVEGVFVSTCTVEKWGQEGELCLPCTYAVCCHRMLVWRGRRLAAVECCG